ncbi:arginase [Flavobacterium frigidarium]|uniref:arginase n=1 Tax=Flavobacterium frigidarium TaxID=99286 RepID=UPI0004133BE7|nr:arginase [Flavobacterium frigidarium]|tara:strand:+ start:3985 stop:4947 length:963 start_codon:yes stop_codon:yes gene_type:complete
MERAIKLIKNRSDIGAGTRGSDMGIDAIEIAAINKNSDYFNLFPFEDVKTHNESIYDKNRNTFAKRIEHVVEQCTRVSYAVKHNLQANYFPIVLSGDHSSALGTISGIKAVYPTKTLGVVWIDAHADLHSPYTSPSGNIHGMPLSAALANDNLDCKINDITPETVQHWENMKNIGVEGTKIKPENLIYFGVRDTEEAEDKQIEKLDIRNYKVDEVRFRGLATCVDEALARLANCDLIYISFDVDSMDCDMISYGTGTPVSKGFDQFEVMEIINRFIKSKKVACLEVVEVNPLLDTKGNKMAETAFDVLENVTETIDLWIA